MQSRVIKKLRKIITVGMCTEIIPHLEINFAHSVGNQAIFRLECFKLKKITRLKSSPKNQERKYLDCEYIGSYFTEPDGRDLRNTFYHRTNKHKNN